MDKFNATSKAKTQPPVVRKYDIDGKEYVVKSVFVGTQDIKTALLNLAEKKAIEEMGLEMHI